MKFAVSCESMSAGSIASCVMLMMQAFGIHLTVTPSRAGSLLVCLEDFGKNPEHGLAKIGKIRQEMCRNNPGLFDIYVDEGQGFVKLSERAFEWRRERNLLYDKVRHMDEAFDSLTDVRDPFAGVFGRED